MLPEHVPRLHGGEGAGVHGPLEQLGAVVGGGSGLCQGAGSVEDPDVHGPEPLEPVGVRWCAGGDLTVQDLSCLPELLLGAFGQRDGAFDEGGEPFGAGGQDGDLGREDVAVDLVDVAELADEPVGAPQLPAGAGEEGVAGGGGGRGGSQVLDQLLAAVLDGAQRPVRLGVPVASGSSLVRIRAASQCRSLMA